jgi:hypothetical protein
MSMNRLQFLYVSASIYSHLQAAPINTKIRISTALAHSFAKLYVVIYKIPVYNYNTNIQVGTVLATSKLC